MKLSWAKKFSFFHSVLLSLAASFPVAAQIKPDTTLTHNSLTTQLGNVIRIDGGTRAGNNLFHSFTQFNVPTGGTAFFNNALDVSNIFSRVTGSSASSIDGILKANGTGNLFLLNPNGIVFGKNAQLNIGGSFLATTASSIKFADGMEFISATRQDTHLLTVSVPIGLGFGNNVGAIKVQGSNLTVPFTSQTLALVGGNVLIEGGYLGATSAIDMQGGRIEIGSVGSNSVVNIKPTVQGWALGYDAVKEFGNIQLSQKATLDISGGGSGYINLVGRVVALTDSSKIFANTLGELNGGETTLQASQINIESGSIVDTRTFSSGNAGNVFFQAGQSIILDGAQIKTTTDDLGNAGNLNLTTEQLIVRNGGQVLVNTNDAGTGGNINVTATSVELIGMGNNGRSGFLAQSSGAGAGGNVTVTTGDLAIRDGAIISTIALDTGNAGNIFVQALNGVSLNNFGNIISTVNSSGTGNGGDIKILARSFSLLQGSQVQSANNGAGDAGNILLQVADTVNVSGLSPTVGAYSSLATTVADGKGGDINIFARLLNVTDGGMLIAGTRGNGNSGNIRVRVADSVNLIATGNTGGITSFSAVVNPVATGNGGDIDIQARTLLLMNGARLSAKTFGFGKAGNVIVNATDNITLSGVDTEGFSSVILTSSDGDQSDAGGNINLTTSIFRLQDGAVLNARTRSASDGGNITINANNLDIINGGQISTTTYSNGNAGKIFIDAKNDVNISGFDPNYSAKIAKFGSFLVTNISSLSGIFANTTTSSTGNGGSILLDARKLTISDGAGISVNSSGQGNAGNLQVRAADSLILDGHAFLSAETASGEGGNIKVQANQLQLRHNSPISATAGNNGNGGNVTMNTNTIVALENSNITANANQGKGGNIQIATQGLFRSPDSLITASSNAGIQSQGIVNIRILGFDVTNSLTPIQHGFGNVTQSIANSCLTSRNQQRGKFTVTGLDGLPVNPYTNFDLWYALPMQPANTTSQQKPSTLPPVAVQSKPWKIGDPIVEATSIMRTADGKIILSSTPKNATPESANSLVCHPNEDKPKS